jgi:Tfp pilus assembly protein PilF
MIDLAESRSIYGEYDEYDEDDSEDEAENESGEAIDLKEALARAAEALKQGAEPTQKQRQESLDFCLLAASNLEESTQRIRMLKRCVDLDYDALEPRAELAMELSDVREYEQADVIFSVVG